MGKRPQAKQKRRREVNNKRERNAGPARAARGAGRRPPTAEFTRAERQADAVGGELDRLRELLNSYDSAAREAARDGGDGANLQWYRRMMDGLGRRILEISRLLDPAHEGRGQGQKLTPQPGTALTETDSTRSQYRLSTDAGETHAGRGG